MDSIELINIIKKMLADNLTTSEREQLLDEKPMINFQSQQWKKAPKAHIQDNVVSQNILNKIMVKSHRVFHCGHCRSLHCRLLDS